MLKPKNCYGDVSAGAFVCAGAAMAVKMNSVATRVATRAGRRYMNPPPGRRPIQYQIGRSLSPAGSRDCLRSIGNHCPPDLIGTPTGGGPDSGITPPVNVDVCW